MKIPGFYIGLFNLWVTFDFTFLVDEKGHEFYCHTTQANNILPRIVVFPEMIDYVENFENWIITVLPDYLTR